MTQPPRKLRLGYTLDPEPVNGWTLARCADLDLVSQGQTRELARATLLEETGLLLAHTQANGGLAPLLERIAGQEATGGDALEIDLTRLP